MGEVVDLPVISLVPVPVEKVLTKAIEAGLTDCVVIGWDADGDLYHASSNPDGPEVLWLLKMTECALLKIGAGGE